MENKRLLFLLNLIKEKLINPICVDHKSIINTIINFNYKKIISSKEHIFLKIYFKDKFKESNLPYYSIVSIEQYLFLKDKFKDKFKDLPISLSDKNAIFIMPTDSTAIDYACRFKTSNEQIAFLNNLINNIKL